VFLSAGSNANPQPCKYSLELQTIAAETIFAHVSAYTSQEQFASAQQSLLAHYRDLAERMETLDSLHVPGPISGRHLCLDAAYQQASTRLKNLAIQLAQAVPPSEPPPPEPLRTLKDVVRNLGEALQPNPDAFPIRQGSMDAARPGSPGDYDQ
jgi:hypothetical protein